MTAAPSAEVEVKAATYLTAGRVTVLAVTADLVVAEVDGTDVWRVVWTPTLGWTWTCPTPARIACAHRAAVQTVTCRAGVLPATNPGAPA